MKYINSCITIDFLSKKTINTILAISPKCHEIYNNIFKEVISLIRLSMNLK